MVHFVTTYHKSCVFALLLLGLLLGHRCSYAQTNEKIKFHKIPAGISSSRITCIFQDQKGFMWFGTGNGLSKFDGYSFVNYQNSALDSNSIGNSNVTHISQDRSEGLWLSIPPVGLNYYDLKTNKFTLYTQGPDSTHLSSGVVNMTAEDKNGQVWLATGNGLNCLNPQTGIIQRYTDDQIGSGYRSGGIRAILVVSEKYVWLATDLNGIVRFDKQSKQFVYFAKDKSAEKEGIILTTCPSQQPNKYWIGYQSEGIALVAIDGPQLVFEQSFTHLPGTATERFGNIKSLCEDKKGRLWAGVENKGIYIIDQQRQAATQHKYNPDDPFSLASDSPWAIREDSSGNVWVGTFQQGVNVVYNQYHTRFEHYFKKNGSINGLVNNSVSGFAESPTGEIWIGTDGGGVSRWNRQNQTFTNYTQDSQPPFQLSCNAILSVASDKQQNTWFTSWENGCNVFSHRDQKFTNYTVNNRGLSANSHFSLMTAQDGFLYMSAWKNTLDVFDTEKQKLVWSKVFPDSLRYFYRIIEDRQQNIWIGSNNGLILLPQADRRPTGQFSVFKYQKQNLNSLSDSRVNEVYEDRQGNIWVGTMAGLNKYDPQTQTFQVFRKKEGLINDDIKGISEDNLGAIWLTTGHGLVRLEAKTNAFERYTKEDGLQGDEFSRGAIYKTRNGEILVGGSNGFNIFDPAKFARNPVVPSVYLTNLKIFNKTVPINAQDAPLTQSLPYTKEIRLSPAQTVFTIEYVALNYIYPEKNQYAYRLEGLEKDWNYVGNRREATYTSLPAGTYTFRVRAANNDGLWNEAGASLTIVVLPPWWKNWWFRGLLLGLIIGGCIWFYNIRVTFLKKQNATLERLIHQRTAVIQKNNEKLTTQKSEIEAKNIEIEAQQRDINLQNQELTALNEELVQINEHLDEMVHERSLALERQHQQLLEYAFFNAHNLRAPLARILGLVEVMRLSEAEKHDAELLALLRASAQELDEVVHQIQHSLGEAPE